MDSMTLTPPASLPAPGLELAKAWTGTCGGFDWWVGPDQAAQRFDLSGFQRNPSARGPAGWLLAPIEAPVACFGRLSGARQEASTACELLQLTSSAGPVGVLAEHLTTAGSPVPRELPLPALYDRGPVASLGVFPDGSSTLVLTADRLARSLDLPIASPSPRPSPLPLLPRPASGQRSRIAVATVAPGLAIATSARRVVEVAPDAPALQVPGAPIWAPRVMVWRDRALPRLDLTALLGLPEGLPGPARLWILMDATGEPVAVPITGSIRVLEVPSAANPARWPTPSAAPLGGVFRLGEETVAVLDLDGLLARPT